MQSLAFLAVERHAWTRASLHGACAAQPPRALICLESSGDAMVFAPRHAWKCLGNVSGFNMPGVEWTGPHSIVTSIQMSGVI